MAGWAGKQSDDIFLLFRNHLTDRNSVDENLVNTQTMFSCLISTEKHEGKQEALCESRKSQL